jgi:hypothetical protein
MSHLLFDRTGATARTVLKAAIGRGDKPRNHWPAPPARYQAAAVAAMLLALGVATLVTQ